MRHCEWSSQLSSELYVELRASPRNRLLGKFTTSSAWRSSAQAQETGFLGNLLQALRGEAPHKPRKTAFLGSLSQTLLGKLRTSHGNYFQGKSPKSLSAGSAQTPGQAGPLFTRPLGAAFPAPGRAPINRQSPQRASSRLERGALWRSLAQPCARNPRNVSV